jgi:hypothetical protein
MDEEETPLRSVNLLSPVAERRAFLRSPLCLLLLVLFVSFTIFNTRASVPFDLLPLPVLSSMEYWHRITMRAPMQQRLKTSKPSFLFIQIWIDFIFNSKFPNF